MTKRETKRQRVVDSWDSDNHTIVQIAKMEKISCDEVWDLITKPDKPDKPTQGERGVWIDHSDNGYLKTHKVGWDTPLICPPSMNSPEGTNYCYSDCAWFRISNGLAMCGDKIIGKLIEPEERNKQ